MSAVAYFTAVIAKSGSGWKARDVEVEEYDDLDDLAEALRSVAVGDQPVLAVVEHEDEWFALVRVDGDDEPRLFVSDLPASAHSHYGPLLAPAADVDAEEELEGDAGAGDDEGSDGESDDGDAPAEEPERPMLAAWAGEVELLEDLGVPAKDLRRLAETRGDDPGAVLAEVGETAGFAELLEALR